MLESPQLGCVRRKVVKMGKCGDVIVRRIQDGKGKEKGSWDIRYDIITTRFWYDTDTIAL